MNDRDAFAVWFAAAALRANKEGLVADGLLALAGDAQTSAELDEKVRAASRSRARPGDFGIEFLVAALPGLLLTLGRMLWDEYSKALAEQGGKALAAATIDKVKELTRRTWSRSDAPISLEDAEARLRQAAAKAGLNAAMTDRLVSSLHGPEMAHEVGVS